MAGGIALLVLVLLPLVRLAFYAVPWYDDYNYGGIVKNFLREEHSFASALKGAAFAVKQEWYAWQGTFSSIFLMALVPTVWGEQYYFWGALLLIFLLLVSLLVLTGVFFRGVLKADWSTTVIFQTLITSMVFFLLYAPQASLYWYNGGIHYTGMQSFLFLLIAAWVMMVAGKGKVSASLLTLWSLLGAVLAGGANYVTVLQGFLVGLTIFAVGMLLKKKRTLLLLFIRMLPRREIQ